VKYFMFSLALDCGAIKILYCFYRMSPPPLEVGGL